MHLQSPVILHSANKKIVNEYIQKDVPLVIKQFATRWRAHQLWTLEYLQAQCKNIRIPIYNNVKSDAYTPVNRADDYITFDKYIEQILENKEHPWRLFLFNIYTQAPHLLKDIDYPTDLMSPIVKQAPMLFIGGKGAITHLHFDIDYSTLLHVQLYGRKKFLLFPFQQQYVIYRKPFEVLAWPDFSGYSARIKELEEEFPKLKEARGYEVVLEPADALIMPPGYWHHIEYLDNSIAVSMRALNLSISGLIRGAWYVTGMRWIDTFMKTHYPIWWNNYKVNCTKYFDDKLRRQFLLPQSTVHVVKPSKVN